ncbi:MAG: TolC family protein [Flavobacteriales bacterium]|nr:TolC family protein [Flavobacteriales bacterium]
MKTRIYKILFLILLMMGVTKSFGQATQDDLDAYLNVAAKNNPGLKASFNNYLAAMEKVPQVGSLPDPKIAFSYFAQSVETRVGPQKWKANISQSFPWFGLLKTKKDVATNMAKAKYEIFENAKSNLFFEIKTAYYNYYYLQRAIAITKENIDILNIFKNLSLVKIEAGKATIADELRVELELNDLQNQLALLYDTQEVFKNNFNNLLNRNVADDILIPVDLWQNNLPIEAAKLVDSIFSNNHLLKSIDQKIEAFNNQEVLDKKVGLPKFTVGLGFINVAENPLSIAKDNGKNAFFPSIGLSIPIYRNKYKAMLKETVLLREGAESEKKEKENKLNTLNKRVLKDYKDSDRRIALNAKQARIAKKVLDVLLTSYSTDAKDFEEVLRMERKLLIYQLAYQKALTDKNAATAFINYLLGN